MTRKYGSFDVEVMSENGKVTTHTVNPLSQQELSNGWRLVLPKKRMINVSFEKDGDNKKIRKTNESFFKINLAQLPPHLFSKCKQVYRRNNFIQYTARDNCYVYIVQPTPVDEEIKKLIKYLELYENNSCNVTEEHLQDIKECVNLLNENEIRGWVLLKVSKIFNLQ